MKPKEISSLIKPCPVAPHAGAWIETVVSRLHCLLWIVAPHAGAWIETNLMRRRNPRPASPPTRGRGLKL